MYFATIASAVVTTILYHVSQKLMPPNANPALALIVTYILAAFLCLMLLPVFPFSGGIVGSLRQVNLASGGLAIATAGSGLAILLAYRAGWRIGSVALVLNSAVAILLMPIGTYFFRERPTAINVVGVVVSILGMAMVNWR